MMELDAELVLAAHAAVAEGPVWDARRGLLWWVDIPLGQVHAYDPRTGADSEFSIGSAVGAVALRRDGSLLVAARDAFATLEPATGRVETLLSFPPEARPRRANDGKCDPSGRFLIGRVAVDEAQGEGGLYSVSADLAVTLLLDRLTMPNGLAWRSDGRELYFIDSPSHCVVAYPYDLSTGALGAGRKLVRFEDDCVPDGMTIDAEDCLWVALWGGSRVVRVAPDGGLIGTLHVPASQTTSCAFGGPDLGDLYITTGREGFALGDDAREPLAGGLFRVRPGVQGMPAVPFAG
jgi:sugar lactone lactonase YvrE